MSYRRSSGAGGWFIGGCVLCVPLLAMVVTRFVMEIGFDQDVGGRLKRAADANSIEMAKTELTAALEGMNRRGCTTGRSHVLWYTPDCDVTFWHNNVKSALDELRAFPTDADPLTVSNQLMKLRETLLDDDSEGVEVTLPPNIVVYPSQVAWCMGFWVTGIMATAGAVCLVIASAKAGH